MLSTLNPVLHFLGLTWGFYFLASHPDVQEKVYEELVEVLDKEDVTHESIASLVYVFLNVYCLLGDASRADDYSLESLIVGW